MDIHMKSVCRIKLETAFLSVNNRGCDDTFIKTWEIQTGKYIKSFI